MPLQLILTYCLLAVWLILLPGSCDESKPKTIRFRAEGAPFTAVTGEAFTMRRDKGKRTPPLQAAWTPFSLDTGKEEIGFDIEVRNYEKYVDKYFISLYIRIDFPEKDYDHVAELIGLQKKLTATNCRDTAERQEFHIKVMEPGNPVPVFEKNELSHLCNGGRSKVFMLKRISSVPLYPGPYRVYVKNRRPTAAFQKYKLSLYVEH